ncbi:MAG: AAA family ATPase [Bacteroidales bacterium]|nr:AAA family ATPase [Bacteroidales bacterium]
MFKKIEIERFRGIKKASIDGFKQINLFLGENNCGKSTLLEALFLANGLSNPTLSIVVNKLRSYHKTNLNDLELNFYNLDSTLPIKVLLQNEEKRDLTIRLYEKNNRDISFDDSNVSIASNKLESEYGLMFNFKINDNQYNSKLQFNLKEQQTTIEFPKQHGKSSRYVDPFISAYIPPNYAFLGNKEALENILKNKDENFIVEGLKCIEPRVEGFAFVNEVVLVDIGKEKRIPINMMGDGTRKIFSILTHLYVCKNGVLLIDEISNGLHYSVMGKLWKVIIKAAIKNNIQLFITTHDYDSIKGLRDTALGKFDEQVAVFSLLKTSEDELKALHYSLESVDYSINQEIEIR